MTVILKFCLHQNHVEWLLNFRLWGPTQGFLIQEVRNGAWELAFLTNSHMMLMLLVQGPHFGNHWFVLVPWPRMMSLSYTIFAYQCINRHSHTAFVGQSSRSQIEWISLLRILPNTLFLPLLSLLHTPIKLDCKLLETWPHFSATSYLHISGSVICTREKYSIYIFE